MTTGDFDLYYPSSPWANITTNSRVYYEAMLQEQAYLKRAVFGNFVDLHINVGDVNAAQMTLSNLIEPHGNNDSIANTALWMTSSRLDSMSRTVGFNHYGGKLALHKYNDLVTYWKGNNDAGLKRIMETALGKMQSDVLEKLARNAFMAHARKFIGDGSLTGFDQVGSSTVLSSSTIRAIHLGMAERDVAYANNPMGQESAIFCVTTPGVIDGIMNSASTGDWLDVQRYNNPAAIVNNEQGTWKGVRFIKSNNACLYNCGTVSRETTITAAITAGDGADDATTGGYLGVYNVGQPSTGVTKYVTVAANTGFAVGDLVTIHKTRTSANGVTNGVDYTEGSAETRIIRKISSTHISFDKPIMETFSTDLGGGVYAYMTKGRHIHSATFIGGPGGVALAVGIPPELHVPGTGEGQLPIIDDVAGMHRFSWDGYFAYAPYTPEVFECWIGAGANRIDFGAMGI